MFDTTRPFVDVDTRFNDTVFEYSKTNPYTLTQYEFDDTSKKYMNDFIT